MDQFGDGCDAYVENPFWCGQFDTAEFISEDMCCACHGGGTAMNTTKFSYIDNYVICIAFIPMTLCF